MCRAKPNGPGKKRAKDLTWEDVLRHYQQFAPSKSNEHDGFSKSASDRMVSEARRKHFDDLLAVVRDWKGDLVSDVVDPVFGPALMIPSSFGEAESEIGEHRRGQLVWRIDREDDVEVWLAVERTNPLFNLLLEHLAPGVFETFQALKSKIVAGIKQSMKTPTTDVSVCDVTSLVIELASKLDPVLATREFEGRCQICIRIEKLTAGTPSN